MSDSSDDSSGSISSDISDILTVRDSDDTGSSDIDVCDNITFVSCYFDLTKYDGKRNKTNNDYLKRMRSVLALKIKLVMFVEKKHVKYVTKHRKKYGLANHTIIVEMPFTELTKYKEYSDRVDASAAPKHLAKSKCTNNYMILTNSKVDLLKYAIEHNFFKTDNIGWLDAGITHVLENDFDYFNLDRFNIQDGHLTFSFDKIRICILRPANKAEYETNDKKLLRSGCQIVAAGIFTARKNVMMEFIDLCNEEFDRCIELHPYFLEEFLFSILFVREKVDFNVYTADYKNIIDNFFDYRECTQIFPMTDLNFVSNCVRMFRMLRKNTLGFNMCKEYHRAILDGKVEGLSKKDIFVHLYEYSIISYYVDREVYRSVRDLFKFYIATDPAIREFYLPMKDHIDANLGFD
jgi:hypothetical protein